MQISSGMAVTNPRANLILLAAMALVSCSSKPDQAVATAPVMKADKPFAAAGSIEMQLDGGDYIIRAAADERIRVSFSGNPGNATAELATSGTHANLAIKDTPHNNFRATVEIPATADLAIHLNGQSRSAALSRVVLINDNRDPGWIRSGSGVTISAWRRLQHLFTKVFL